MLLLTSAAVGIETKSFIDLEMQQESLDFLYIYSPVVGAILINK